MEHIEQAGVHSATAPARCRSTHLKAEAWPRSRRQTGAMAHGLNVVGLMNVQFAIQEVPMPATGRLTCWR